MSQNNLNTSEISHRDFLAAVGIVATVIAERFWHSTQGPQTISIAAPAGPAAMPILEACSYIGIGETQFRKLWKDGDVPEPRSRNGRRKLWYKTDLDKYLALKAKAK